MLENQTNNSKINDFILKQQFKQTQLDMLYFLFNSEFQNIVQKFQQKTSFHIQSKKYQRSVTINSTQVKQLFHILSQKLHQKILKNDHDCYKALNKLQSLWEQNKIQYFHRYYFEKYIFETPLNNAMTLIKNQDNLIRSKQHIYYSIQKTIWARQACLNHLRRQLKLLGQQDIYQHLQTVRDRQIDRNRKIQKRMYKVYGYRAKLTLDEKQTKLGITSMEVLSEDINNYRRLTYHLVELVARWKIYMQSLTPDLRLRKQKMQFYYKDKNLYITIMNDSSFISSSFLSNFYSFSNRNDPFLLKPILNLDRRIEEGQQTNFQTIELKRLINCKLEDIPKINTAISYLYAEVNWNLTHQKYYDKKGLLQYRSVSLKISGSDAKFAPQAISKSRMSLQSSQKLSPIKLLKQNSRELVKSNVIIRKKSEAPTLLKTTSRKTNNPQINPLTLLDSSELKFLKEQIYKKVKDQLQFQSKKAILQSKTFSDRIDEQVRQTFQRYLSNNAKQMLEQQYQITPLSFYEEQVSSFITRICKQIPVQFTDTQMQQSDLLKAVIANNYSYILKVHTVKDQIANIIANVNRNILEYKSVEVQLISFKFPQTLEKIILKMVEFFWKYDNAKEIILKFYYTNQQTKQFVKQLQAKLEPNCTIVQKKYKIYTQSKFIFTSKIFNKRYIFNPHAQKIHFKLYSALSLQKVQLQSIEDSNLSMHLNYDYLIMEILRRHTNSEDFITLRDTFKTKDRFRYLINQLMQREKHKDFEVNINFFDGQNFTQINHKLRYLKKPLLEVTDLVLINNIKMIQMEYTLTIAYQMKALSTWDNQHFHRYVVKEEISYLCDDLGCQFYLLPVQETQHLKVLVFSAPNYLSKYQKGLNMYLYETLQRSSSKWQKKYVENIWIQMLRYPPNYAQRQAFLLNSYRTHEFDSINKELIIGESLDWFTDIQIQNGLQYKQQKDDIYLRRPLGVGVITNKNWILYCRVVDKDNKGISENV